MPIRPHTLLVLAFVLTVLPCAGSAQERAPEAAPPPQTFPLWDGKESVAAYAQRTGLKDTLSFDLPNGSIMEFVLIPAGKFKMGISQPPVFDRSPLEKQAFWQGALLIAAGFVLVAHMIWIIRRARKSRSRPRASLGEFMVLSLVAALALLGWLNHAQARAAIEESLRLENLAWEVFRYCPEESPPHFVTLTSPFYLSKYEVTQRFWDAFMEVHPSIHIQPDFPADSMTWKQANEFCARLGRHLERPCRLPTEAEWEYACRAGTTSAFSFGDDLKLLPNYAWLPENSPGKPMSVGLKVPNPWGLYDMHGNAWEWCQDWFGNYTEANQTNPLGPKSGQFHVIRGGSWMNIPLQSRSSARWDHYWGKSFSDDVGMRVLLEVREPSSR